MDSGTTRGDRDGNGIGGDSVIRGKKQATPSQAKESYM
jgi:hypothetical protein